MPRLMAVSLTEQAVIDRTKTVTRRLGWEFLKPGDPLTLCRKVQGRRRRDGTLEPLVRLAEVEVVSVDRVKLGLSFLGRPDEVAREGVDPALWATGEWMETVAEQWVNWFCREMNVHPSTPITRVGWRYLDG